MRRVLSVFIAVCLVLSLFTRVFAPVPSATALTDGLWTYTVVLNKATITGYTGLGGGIVVIPSTIGVGPYPVTAIGDSAFNSTQGHLLTSVTIPNSVVAIGGYAFDHCTALTSVTIPNSVTSIGYWAFDDCTGLTSVTIPNSVTSIEYAVFCGCTALTSVTIPNSVTAIPDYAFDGCSGLTSVTIPNRVASIGTSAFEDCSGLTGVTIGSGVTSIGTNAFGDCTALASVTIPNSVITIGTGAFWICTGLTSVTIGTSVTSIGGAAFYGCSGLTSVIIPNSATSIGTSAFRFCSGLTSLTIGTSVTSIGDSAFQQCSGLTSVTIGNSVSSIGDGAFWVCTGLTSVTIGNSVTTIGGYAFDGCSGLTTVTIPNSVTSIGDAAFYDCSKLTSVTIGSGVATLGDGAFRGCSGLTSVTIPNSVITVGNWAFFNCTKLASAYFLGNAPTIGTDVFASCATGFTVRYVSGTTGWNDPWHGYPTTATYTLVANVTGSGSIGRSPDAASYASGTVVTLTAAPATGYTFTGWSGGLTGTTNPTTITMDANKTVTAVFVPSTGSYTLSLTPSWNVISVPFSTPVSLLPTGDLFLAWDGSLWQGVTTLLPGTGYLVRNTAGATTITLTGTPSSSPQTQPATGTWQIMGNPYTTPASFACTTSVPYLLTWDGSLWQPASPTNLPPGLGFLLQASSPGTITVTRLP